MRLILKLWLWLSVVFIMLYAPVELSRLIIEYWGTYGLVQPFWAELALIWTGWGLAMFFLGRALYRDLERGTTPQRR